MYLDHIHPFNFSPLTPFRFHLQVSSPILFLISHQVPVSAVHMLMNFGLPTVVCHQEVGTCF